MAQGDVTIFQVFRLELGKETHDLSSDALYVGLVDDTLTPAEDDTTPTWSDYSANEVTTGTSYSANGVALTNITWAVDGNGDVKLDADNVTVAQDASGFTDARWAIIYNSDAASGEAIGFVDLGGAVSIQGGPLNINWDGTNGIARFGAGTIT